MDALALATMPGGKCQLCPLTRQAHHSSTHGLTSSSVESATSHQDGRVSSSDAFDKERRAAVASSPMTIAELSASFLAAAVTAFLSGAGADFLGRLADGVTDFLAGVDPEA